MEKATIYNYARMCKNIKECEDCPLGVNNNGEGIACSDLMMKVPDKANKIILKWCKEHPIKTRQSEFLKMFPNAVTNGNGRPSICPNNLDRNYGCELEPNSCCECMDNYWLAEVDENV